MWSEVVTAKTEKRHELILSGNGISERIEQDGLDLSIFDVTTLNFLNISETTLNSMPDDVTKLYNLQTLLLHSNKFEYINEKLTLLQKLKVLDLSRNVLKEVPESFAGLLQIITLNLSLNQLNTFPTFTKNTKLCLLDLSHNKLQTFPDICYEELSNLAELKLSFNEIEEIPNSIHVLPSLKLLEINSNKIKVIPGELADCHKLKDVNLKENPIIDRRLFKLVDQCRTPKQVLDYVRQHCVRFSPSSGTPSKIPKKTRNKSNDPPDSEDDETNATYKHTIMVKSANENFKVVVTNSVKNIREHIVCCMVNNVEFTEELFKKFIQLQNKLHDGVCNKRTAATIATHDFSKLPPGSLVYTTSNPSELIIKPLNRVNNMSGAELFAKLQAEANHLRKEKKRNTYSGIHKYLILIEGKPMYPCLLNANKEVISFPPITNSDISKICVQTKTILIEVTSSTSQLICKTALDLILKEMVVLFQNDLEVQQVRTVDEEDHLKTVYPSKIDLCYSKTDNIKVVRN